mmetsp:Transcript_26156/g.46533  ORF Transcript_26156/g.46533 Transcript_26156/m.46533 type:complete len:127 (-) Transcript_26156:4838-5218(-)
MREEWLYALVKPSGEGLFKLLQEDLRLRYFECTFEVFEGWGLRVSTSLRKVNLDLTSPASSKTIVKAELPGVSFIYLLLSDSPVSWRYCTAALALAYALSALRFTSSTLHFIYEIRLSATEEEGGK